MAKPACYFLGALLLLGFLSGCDAPERSDSAPPTPKTTESPLPSQTTAQPEPVPVDPPTYSPVPIANLLGKIDQAKDPDFVRIDRKYTNKSAIYLRRDAYLAFEKMYAAAREAGFTLNIISATRNFNYQKGIWERKWTGVTKVGGKNLAQALPDPTERARAILRYSSMPGTSRHHWGTDIDLNSLDNAWFAAGTGKKLYTWLVQNAPSFGYCQTYTEMDESRPRGYQEEKWHWSYMPIAANYLNAYRATVDYADIAGFKGAEAARGMNVIEDYVGGIGPQCREWK
ncbi:MAG: M15 family metallopeptidase [Bacteroidota bacterium]